MTLRRKRAVAAAVFSSAGLPPGLFRDVRTVFVLVQSVALGAIGRVLPSRPGALSMAPMVEPSRTGRGAARQEIALVSRAGGVDTLVGRR